MKRIACTLAVAVAYAAVPLLASTPGIADEFALRLTSATQRTDERWTPFANLHS